MLGRCCATVLWRHEPLLRIGSAEPLTAEAAAMSSSTADRPSDPRREIVPEAMRRS